MIRQVKRQGEKANYCMLIRIKKVFK